MGNCSSHRMTASRRGSALRRSATASTTSRSPSSSCNGSSSPCRKTTIACQPAVTTGRIGQYLESRRQPLGHVLMPMMGCMLLVEHVRLSERLSRCVATRPAACSWLLDRNLVCIHAGVKEVCSGRRVVAFAPSCWRRSAACCARFRLRLVNSTRAPHCDSALVVAYLRSMRSV